jgi:hypothetical protein
MSGIKSGGSLPHSLATVPELSKGFQHQSCHAPPILLLPLP